MNAILEQRLEWLKNRATRYEVIATMGAEKVLVGYTARRGRRGIMGVVQLHPEAWIRFTGSDCITFAKTVAGGATLGGWAINFSGRTQRDAYILGELPFITDMAERKEAA